MLSDPSSPQRLYAVWVLEQWQLCPFCKLPISLFACGCGRQAWQRDATGRAYREVAKQPANQFTPAGKMVEVPFIIQDSRQRESRQSTREMEQFSWQVSLLTRKQSAAKLPLAYLPASVVEWLRFAS